MNCQDETCGSEMAPPGSISLSPRRTSGRILQGFIADESTFQGLVHVRPFTGPARIHGNPCNVSLKGSFGACCLYLEAITALPS